jgi:uncharacterized protein Yka (UPF0111/DUF47 family)
MARNKSESYYDTFVDLVSYSCQAAELLSEIMHNFEPDKLQEQMKKMHAIEHSGDTERHQMIRRLAREFITPIEREDIMDLGDAIDTVTDTIEDVLMRLYMCNVRSIRPYALRMAQVITRCSCALKRALDEFHNFRKSQALHTLIVDINRLEEEGDQLFTEAMRDLYANCPDLREVIAWDQIFFYLEIGRAHV